jgi:hypothetical protein
MMIFYEYWLIPYFSEFKKAVMFLLYVSKINVVLFGLHYHSAMREFRLAIFLTHLHN